MVKKRFLCFALISVVCLLVALGSASASSVGYDGLDLGMLFGLNFVEIPIPEDQVRFVGFVVEIHAADYSEPIVFDELGVIFSHERYINGDMWAGIVYRSKPLVKGEQEVLLILGQKDDRGFGRTTFSLDLAEYGFGLLSSSQLLSMNDIEVKLNHQIPVYYIYPDSRRFSGLDLTDIDALLERYERIFVLSVIMYDHLPSGYLD